MANIDKIQKRRKYFVDWKRNNRHKLRKEHRCIWCKKKVKPVTTYPQFCQKHNQRNRERLKQNE